MRFQCPNLKVTCASLCPTPLRLVTRHLATPPTGSRLMRKWKCGRHLRRGGCWYNLVFPRFNARVHCTERPVGNALPKLIQDAQSLVFGHEVAAAGIRRHALDLPRKSGMIYVLEDLSPRPSSFSSRTAPRISCAAPCISTTPPTQTAPPRSSNAWKRTSAASWNPSNGREALDP